MTTTLRCFATFDHPRLRYVLDVLTERFFACAYELVLDPGSYAAAEGPCLNYSRQRQRPDECWIPATGLLRSEGIAPVEVEVGEHRGRPTLFPQDLPGADLPFDLLAMVFYLLSRYEEYGPYRPDRHGRYPAAESLAARHHFLERPLVDEWAIALGEAIRARHPAFRPPDRVFDVCTSYDIDHAWAYRYRPLWLLAAGAVRAGLSGHWRGLGERARVWSGRAPDPFDTFSYLLELDRARGLRSLFFFLLPTRLRGPDRTISPDNPALRQRIRSIAQDHQVGIHPSYGSFGDPGRMGEEIETLRAIIARPVARSRQHFLRLRLPDTYRHLLANGISHDHSLAYAEAPGFRASTARPFPWYDLERERRTELMVHPVQVMDGTLKNYLGLAPEAALPRIRPIIDRTRASGGQFSLIWHNSSFGQPYGWSGWKKAYEEVLDYLLP